MTAEFRIVLLVFSVVFFICVVRMVVKEKLQLKYALLWMLLAVALVVCAVFPGLVAFFSDMAGVHVTSNFVFTAGFVFLIVVCLSLSVIVSWQARDIRSLVQQVALLRKELEERCGENAKGDRR